MDESLGGEESRSVSSREHSLTLDNMDEDTSTGAESTTVSELQHESNKEKLGKNSVSSSIRKKGKLLEDM